MATTATHKPLRLRPPPVPEADLHAAVAAALTVLLPPHVPWTTFPAGHVQLAPAQAARLARLGLQRGWPDILVVHEGRVHGLELKRPGRALSRSRWVRTRNGSKRYVEGQHEAFRRLERAGMHIATCTSVREAICALEAWGIPVRGHA
jgi:hypothetical protein